MNQVVFASDGVANVGETDPKGILAEIGEDAGRGIQMLAIGVGLGEFNDDAVRSWRLIGFENRAITDREFDNEATDAGEIGSGHSVTALYELELRDGGRSANSDLLATVTLPWVDVKFPRLQ